MYVSNMISNSGNKVPNQFVVTSGDTTYFQSYDTIVAKIEDKVNGRDITIDTSIYDPKLAGSRTTAKYLARFLSEKKKDTLYKIQVGLYRLTNLNEG